MNSLAASSWTKTSRAARLAPLVLALVTLAGCAPKSQTVEIRSLKDPYFPETYEFEAARCFYRETLSGDAEIVAFGTRPPNPEVDTREHWLQLQLFWKPNPARTPDDPTCVNALVTLVAQSPTGSLRYTGAGYVFITPPRHGQPLRARLEASHLQLESRGGELADALGPQRIVGELLAQPDAAAAIELRREAEIAGARTRFATR